jgi:hypothetical protein
MSDETAGSAAGDDPGGAVLREIDPDLNIFALANGLDLFRDPGGAPARVLEWYRDGMERRIHLTPSSVRAGALDVAVGALARREGVKIELRRPFQAAVAPSRLRTVLPQAIEGGNALARDQVEREGTPPG